MKYLPLKNGVQKGLSDLHNQSFRISALINSPEDIVRSRMESTELISYFEFVFSAEQVRKYRPAMEVYRWVAECLCVPIAEISMVSIHS